MNQEKFLNELERLLSDIPEDERREAMEYYRCYFEDAGVENEESVLTELVSPEKVARTIKADLRGDTADGGFTEKGYEEFTEKSVPGTKEQIADEEKRKKGNEEKKGRSSYTDVWEKMPQPDQYENYRQTYEEPKQRREQNGEHRENGQYQRRRGQYYEESRQRHGQYHEESRQRHGQYHEESGQRREQRRRGGGSAVGKVFAIFGIGVAIIAVVIALGTAAIGLIGATVIVGGAAVGLMGVAVGLFVSGAFATALALLGGGFICLAFFFLLLLAVVAVCAKAFPTALRSICNAAGDILFDREERAR